MFQPQFAPLVLSGKKRQTIRPMPKRMPKVGDVESWREWTGKPYRSKTRELAQVEIILIVPVTIYSNGVVFPNDCFFPPNKLLYFANQDGFPSFRALTRWFSNTHGLPFKGILIKAMDAPASNLKLPASNFCP